MTHWQCIIIAIIGNVIFAIWGFRMGVKQGFRVAADATREVISKPHPTFTQ